MPLQLAASDEEKLELKKQEFRAKLATATYDEDDPLAVYDQFVNGRSRPMAGTTQILAC